MTLTKDQRFTAYCILLSEAEKYNYRQMTGLCKLSMDLFGEGFYNIGLLFPEYMKHRPKSNSKRNWYWFDTDKRGWGKRVEILNQCIKETA